MLHEFSCIDVETGSLRSGFFLFIRFYPVLSLQICFFRFFLLSICLLHFYFVIFVHVKRKKYRKNGNKKHAND
jgi:hypothetical protein